MKQTSPEILKALQKLIEPGNVAELRIIDCKDGNYSANYTGYFDDLEKMAMAAVDFDGAAPAVYITLHKCKPALLARAANRMIKAGKKSVSTSDHDVEKFCWFPVDVDAKRPAGISSSDLEHEAAIERTHDIKIQLVFDGWPEPIIGDSGNGGHLLFKTDIANTPENVEFMKNAMLALHQQFSDDLVEVDRTVFNASRIWKLYGTMTKKGDPTPDRPHRRAKILNVPEIVSKVSLEKIKELAAKVKIEQKAPALKTSVAVTSLIGESIDPAEWCRRFGLNIHHDANWKDGVKYQVTPCPFNDSHSEAVIIKHPSGAVSFKCLHNGCFDKTWRDLRNKFEPMPARPNAPKPQEYKQNNFSDKPELISKPGIDPRINTAKDFDQMIEELGEQERGEKITLSMPWKRLSDGCKALRPGTMTILAGPMKTGKSFFTMNIIRHICDMGHSFAYLPLEDNRKEWAWRMLALLQEDYRLIDKDQEGVKLRADALVTWQTTLEKYTRHVTENPRSGIKNSAGETLIPEVAYTRVLAWIAKAAKTARLIVVDPISQIDFKGRDKTEQESDFVRGALGVISDTPASLILVAHTVKRSGAAAAIELSAEDVQGSAMYTRLAHTTLLLNSCDMKQAEVFRSGGTTETIIHDRIVTIAAARNGCASRQKIAFLQNKNRPHFEELGVLAPKKGRQT